MKSPSRVLGAAAPNVSPNMMKKTQNRTGAGGDAFGSEFSVRYIRNENSFENRISALYLRFISDVHSLSDIILQQKTAFEKVGGENLRPPDALFVYAMALRRFVRTESADFVGCSVPDGYGLRAGGIR